MKKVDCRSSETDDIGTGLTKFHSIGTGNCMNF
jgi:hypothetical protein